MHLLIFLFLIIEIDFFFFKDFFSKVFHIPQFEVCLSYLIHLINSILLEEPPNTLTTQRDLQNARALFLHNIIWSYDRHKKYKRMKAAVFGLFGGTWRGQLKGCHMLNQQYNRKSLY